MAVSGKVLVSIKSVTTDLTKIYTKTGARDEYAHP